MATRLTMSTETPAASAAIDDLPDDAIRQGRSVRGHLALFTVALSLPILVFGAFVLWRFAASERTRLEYEAGEIAQTVATMIDRELTGVFAALDVLSTSAYLASGDLESFDRQAREVERRQGIVTVLVSADGQQLVNVRLPWNAPLPRSGVTWDEAALAAGRPFVTDLIVGQVTGQRQVLAAIPVRKGDAVASILFFSIPLQRLQRVLQDAEVPAAYTASIVDRAGTILARSVRADEFVGKTASADLRENTSGRRGTWQGTTVDGAQVFGAYARSNLSGYVAATGIRYSDLDAPLWRSLALFAALGIAILALSLMLGLFFGKRITAPIVALAREAARLGRGEPVAPLRTGLSEANRVGEVLAGASVALREREADLRDANEEIQRFAYIVSHDLRSPLVNIMGFTTELEALRQDVFHRLEELRTAAKMTGDPADAALAGDFDEALGFIKTSIAKMDRLINAILQLSRLGRREFHPERVDMKALVTTITASLAIQAEARNATVSAAQLPTVVSDRLALEQIFSNLLDNALKYLRVGVPGQVVVEGSIVGATAVYEVRDNGRGIEARDMDRVFDLFRRSGVQDRPGEGIGLAHVRTLVRRLGGTISLTSEPGRGSTFTVTLPRRWAGEKRRKAA